MRGGDWGSGRWAIAAAGALFATSAVPGDPAQIEDLTRLSVSNLANVQVTSVLKSPEPFATRVQGGHLRSDVFCSPGGELESPCNFSVAALIRSETR